MISKLISPSVSFLGQDSNSSVRKSYNEMLEKNKQIATNANNAIEAKLSSSAINTQIPMKGNAGQKLDVIA